MKDTGLSVTLAGLEIPSQCHLQGRLVEEQVELRPTTGVGRCSFSDSRGVRRIRKLGGCDLLDDCKVSGDCLARAMSCQFAFAGCPLIASAVIVKIRMGL